MAVIWNTVLVLPMPDTRTRARSPSSAIHSRSAETTISRPMMMAAASANGALGFCCTSSTSAVATISLSATGSRKAPKVLSWFMRRAM
ncbi:hypothetical protein D3C83_40420 [compost metagenome]